MTAIADAQLESIGVDVSKLTYTLMQPPEELPPIYPKLEQPAAPPVAAPVDPILLAQQYAAAMQQQQPPVAARQHRRRKKRKSILGQLKDTALLIKSRLDAYVPEFVGFEDDDSEDEEEEYAVDSIDRRQPAVQPPPPTPGALQGEFSYGQRVRLPAATAPPMEASYQPITQPAGTYAPPLAAGLYQKISSHYSAVKLKSEGVTVADLIAADVKVVDFRRAGYTLDEVHHLVPEYEFLLKLGADRALFDNKWRVSTLCELYRLPFASVCSSLKLNAGDLLRAGLGLDQVAATGLTLGQLIDLGADFEFIRAMRSPPYKVSSRLKATRYDLERLNFSRDEKLKLQKELGWKTTSMIGTFGITAASAGEDWLPIPIESMIGNVSW